MKVTIEGSSREYISKLIEEAEKLVQMAMDKGSDIKVAIVSSENL